MQKNVEEEEEVFVLMNNDGEKVFREKSTTIDGTYSKRSTTRRIVLCVFFLLTRVSACHSERTRQCWIVDLSGTERSFLLRVS